MKNSIFLLVGPSGVGKTSFLEKLLEEFSSLRDVITYTTRDMRQGEAEGNPYHFVTKDKFKSLIDEGFFVEWAQVHTNLYGTPMDQIHQAWGDECAIAMDIDIQGARTMMSKFPQTKVIFVLPPSLDSLRERLMHRDGGQTADYGVRLENAKKEIAVAGEFHYQVVNEEFSQCYSEIKKIIEESLSLV